MPKQKKRTRVSVDNLDKPARKLTSKEQKKVKGGTGTVVPTGSVTFTVDGVARTTIGGALNNTIGLR